METSSYVFCLLFIFVNFFVFFRLRVIFFSFQLELTALSLGPKAPSVSLCREHFQRTRPFTVALSRGWSALPCGPELMKLRQQSSEVTEGKGQRMEPRDHSQWGSSCEQGRPPSVTAGDLAACPCGSLSMVTLAVCDLLTGLQTFPHSGRFDILLILLGSPEWLSVWAKPAFVYNFSGNFHSGGKTLPPFIVFYF